MGTRKQLERFIRENELCNVRLMPFFSMVDRRKKLHQETVANLPQRYPDMLTTPIPYASVVGRMGVERCALGSFAARSVAAKAYEALWKEIKERIEKV